MNEPTPISASKSLFAMTQTEQVTRQQLNILQLWNARLADESEHNAVANTNGAKHALEDLPHQWTLLPQITPRIWQLECRESWFRAGKNGVIKVVTGAGKTVLACTIIEQLQNTEAPDLRVAIVVPTIVLLEQWYELLAENSNLPRHAIGRLGGGYQDGFDSGKRVLICVLNSAASKLPKLAASLDAPLLLIVDECHRAGASQMSGIFQTRRTYNLGLSATPERDKEVVEDDESASVDSEPVQDEDFDDTLLGRELGPIVFELGYRQALDDEILAKFMLHHYGLPLEPQERIRYERMSREITDLRRSLQGQMKGRARDGGMLVGWARKMAAKGGSTLSAQAANYVRLTGQRKHLVYHARAREMAVKRLVIDALAAEPNTRILLFHESVSEVMRLFALLRSEGISIVAENSQLPDILRSESLHLFRTGAARVLVSARSLIEGFDVPAADVGIVVASSSSVRQRIQTLGRILRKKTGEERAAVLHVLYMAETTDEMIYEKEDWAAVTGAERNRYFVWDPTQPDSVPLEREDAPRKPKPTEDKLDWTLLIEGNDYPGRYEGEEYSADSQGNVKSADGRIATNPQKVPESIDTCKGSLGRFRVTPRKHAILVPAGEGGRIILAGFLAEPFQWALPGEVASRQAELELWVRSKAGGYRIARKIPDGEAFARTGEHALDRSRGMEAESLAQRVKEVESDTGKVIRKLRLLPNGEVMADVKGERILLIKLIAGLEFADRILP